jgi:pimeloyl-ACP methyl ester carboxylesterase
MEQFVDDLDAVAEHCGTPPVLVGASMGGLIGLFGAARAPERFSALILVDITPRWDAGGVARILDFMGAHPDGFADFEAAADAIAAYLPQRAEKKTPDQLRSLLVKRDDGRLRWHWDPRLLAEIARGGERYQDELMAAAQQIQIPTLLISGGRSDLILAGHVAEFLQLAPKAQHVQIADATHMVAGDRNDQFTDSILEFLTTVAPATASTGASS